MPQTAILPILCFSGDGPTPQKRNTRPYTKQILLKGRSRKSALILSSTMFLATIRSDTTKFVDLRPSFIFIFFLFVCSQGIKLNLSLILFFLIQIKHLLYLNSEIVMSQANQKCQIYLAGPFFNPDQISRIEKIEKILRSNKTVKNFFSPRQQDKFVQHEFLSEPWTRKVYENNQTHIINCDLVLAILDYEGHNVDSGTAFEIGFAVALKKPIIVFHEGDYPVNLMISQTLRFYCKKFQELEQYDFQGLPGNKYEGKIF